MPGISQRQVRCSWDTILTPRSIQESGWFSGIQTRTLGRTPDKSSLRGNEGRELSDDRGVNHIHHTSINPHTAIIGFLTTFKRTQIIQTKCGGEWHENLDTQHEGLDGARHWQCTLAVMTHHIVSIPSQSADIALHREHGPPFQPHTDDVHSADNDTISAMTPWHRVNKEYCRESVSSGHSLESPEDLTDQLKWR